MDQTISGTQLYIRTLGILAFCLFAFLPLAFSQQVIVNSNGDKIIMYPDGSWRPVESRDSLLLKQSFQKTEPILDPNLESSKAANRNKAEEQNYLIQQVQELKLKVQNQEKKVMNEFRNATNAQFKAAEMLHNAEANKNVIEPQRLDALAKAYETSVKNLRQAKLNQKAIKKIFANVLVLANNKENIKKGKLEQLKSKYNVYLANFEAKPAFKEFVVTPPPPPVKSDSENQSKTKPNKTEKTESSTPEITESNTTEKSKNNAATTSTVVALTLPVDQPRPYVAQPFDCLVKIDTIDAELDRRQIEVAQSVIFTHTDADLRPYFKDKELITCKGSMLKIGPYVYLSVQFQIASSYSQNNFGALQKESLFRLKLLNNEYVSLYNIKADRGHIDAYTGNTVFTGQYALGKDEIRRLKESGLDKIRVLWLTGFEDYDVYNVDFFIDQLECLESQ